MLLNVCVTDRSQRAVGRGCRAKYASPSKKNSVILTSWTAFSCLDPKVVMYEGKLFNSLCKWVNFI